MLGSWINNGRQSNHFHWKTEEKKKELPSPSSRWWLITECSNLLSSNIWNYVWKSIWSWVLKLTLLYYYIDGQGWTESRERNFVEISTCRKVKFDTENKNIGKKKKLSRYIRKSPSQFFKIIEDLVFAYEFN